MAVGVIVGSIRASLVGLCFLYLPRARADHHVSDEAAHLLATAKEASGGAHWETVVTWHESGRISKGGIEGTFDRWLNFVGLRNAATFEFDRSCRCEGWNGNLFGQLGQTASQDQQIVPRLLRMLTGGRSPTGSPTVSLQNGSMSELEN